MKKLILYCLGWLPVLAVFQGCTKDGLILYEKSPDIYFSNWLSETAQTTDRSYVRFYYMLPGVTWQDVPVNVSVTGALVDSDRPINVTIDPRSTAEAGKHYEILSATVPAGAATADIVVRVHRADLKEKGEELWMRLELQPNEHFGTNFQKSYNQRYKDTVYYTVYDIYMSDVLTRPQNWMNGFYGAYSDKKLELICALANISAGYMNGEENASGVRMEPAEMMSIARAVKQWLALYESLEWTGGAVPDAIKNPVHSSPNVPLPVDKAAGVPYYETNGTTPMTMGTSI